MDIIMIYLIFLEEIILLNKNNLKIIIHFLILNYQFLYIFYNWHLLTNLKTK